MLPLELITNFVKSDFNLDFKFFILKMTTDLKSNFLNFIKTFSKFNITYRFYNFNFKKLKKNSKTKLKKGKKLTSLLNVI